MSHRPFISILALALWLALPLLAQSPDRSLPPESKPGDAATDAPKPAPSRNDGRLKQHEVEPGQLTPEAIERMKKEREEAAKARAASGQPGEAPLAPIAGSVKRTRADVETMLRDMAATYRSVCCPFQNMLNDKCPCHDTQMAMLEFLILQGYTREQIDAVMVRGADATIGQPAQAGQTAVPGDIAALTTAYRAFVIARGKEPAVDSFYMNLRWNIEAHRTAQAGDASQDVRTLGWHKGWGELLHQAPNDPLLYIIPIVAVLLCIGVFGYGWYLMRARKAQAVAAATADGAAAPPAVSVPQSTANAASPALADRINAEARALDEE